jgi:hypothetical protein
VFATRTGRPFGQRNVACALPRAGARPDAAWPADLPVLFEHDERNLIVERSWAATCPDGCRGVSYRRREALRARMEATDGDRSQQTLTPGIGEMVDLRLVREVAQ